MSELITSAVAEALAARHVNETEIRKIIRMDISSKQLASCIFNALSSLHAGCQSALLTQAGNFNQPRRWSSYIGDSQSAAVQRKRGAT